MTDKPRPLSDEELAEIRRDWRAGMVPQVPGQPRKDVAGLLATVEELGAAERRAMQVRDETILEAVGLKSERDEARAEVERLRGLLLDVSNHLSAGSLVNNQEQRRLHDRVDAALSGNEPETREGE